MNAGARDWVIEPGIWFSNEYDGFYSSSRFACTDTSVPASTMVANKMSSDAGYPSWWDPYSNQPYKLANDGKPRLTASNTVEYLKVAATALAISPRLLWRFARTKATPCSRPATQFVGLSITPCERYNEQIRSMVAELGVRELLIRIPSWDLERLDAYADFAEQFSDHHLLFNILQSRDSVLRPEVWRNALEAIFSKLRHLSSYFQIGNAVNRSKWGCAHSGEYLALLETAERVRTAHPEVTLVGSSVIDFEPLVTLRTLYNRRRYHLDVVTALLYVNRRGSPYGRQYLAFDLRRKLRLLRALVDIGNRNDGRLWITECNWPLLHTQPYTPNSGHPDRTVDEATQAHYLTEYYRIAYHCGWVEKVYWWELINPGYGLVDHRSGSLRKMPSYFAFKALLEGGLLEPPSA
ncbi:MAG: hypothetical protein MAG794_00167 [Gammaproteobacteria bacterium]|nr:hypothetical protein [Gammaproteobacteria bacterium]